MQTIVNKFGTAIALSIIGVVALAAVVMVAPATASATIHGGIGGNGISDLFVLDRLFGVGGSGTGLGDLFILDQLFGGSGI